MKRLLFLTFIIALFTACENPKQDNKKETTTADTIEKNDTPVAMEDEESWIGSKPMETVKIDTAVNKNSALKIRPKTKKTPEQIKRDDEIRDARIAFKRGVDAYNSKKNDEAIQAFKQTLMYDAENALANYNLGKIYYETGQKELALKYYQDAENLNPKDSNSVVAIGLIYFEKGMFDMSEEYFNKAVEMAPGYGLAYYDRGTLYGQQKRYDESLADLKKAAIYSPEDSRVYMNMGLAYFFKKDMDSACKNWNKAASMGNSEAQKAIGIYCKKNPAK
ncbi:MAG: hypothetical protein C0595_03780 [Marinilabiliales bacterium]|nr:MAG: hypothetical protein C0595_03780 [Marinilabiliales bacterium]